MLAGEHVRPPTRVLDAGIGVTLDNLHAHETRPGKLARHDLRGEEHEVQRDGTAEELLDANRPVADVEGQRSKAALLQDPRHLGESGTQLIVVEMDD